MHFLFDILRFGGGGQHVSQALYHVAIASTVFKVPVLSFVFDMILSRFIHVLDRYHCLTFLSLRSVPFVLFFSKNFMPYPLLTTSSLQNFSDSLAVVVSVPRVPHNFSLSISVAYEWDSV